MFSRFDTNHVRDGRTDGRTELPWYMFIRCRA